jgi:hypothetical protein
MNEMEEKPLDVWALERVRASSREPLELTDASGIGLARVDGRASQVEGVFEPFVCVHDRSPGSASAR